MGRVEQYRAELKRLTEWEAYLKKNSGLPGPRANLELVEAVGEEADPERLWRLSASSDEFLALCGTAGLGHVAASDPVTVMSWLREFAADPRWRVREGVAIALQHMGHHSMARLLAEMERWCMDGPFVQRAAIAGLCEPSLLKEPEHVTRVLRILDRTTRSLAATGSRKGEGFQVLRQALGYCWSVAAAALPEEGRPLMEKWLRSSDKDVAWVMKTNLTKARIGQLGASWVAKWRGRAPAATPAPTSSTVLKAGGRAAEKQPKGRRGKLRPAKALTGWRRPRSWVLTAAASYRARRRRRFPRRSAAQRAGPGPPSAR